MNQKLIGIMPWNGHSNMLVKFVRSSCQTLCHSTYTKKNGKRVIAALKIRNYATLPRSIHNPAEPHTVMPIAARQRTACAIPQGKYGVFGQQTRRICIANTANLHRKHGDFTVPLAANVKPCYYQKDAQRPSKAWHAGMFFQTSLPFINVL